MTVRGPLSSAALDLLAAVRVADEEEGGMALVWDEVDEDAKEAASELLERGYVEWKDSTWLRITGAGVAALRDA